MIIRLIEGICRHCSQCGNPDDRWEYRQKLSDCLVENIAELRLQVEDGVMPYEKLVLMCGLANQINAECSRCCSVDGNSEAWKLVDQMVMQPIYGLIDKTKEEERKSSIREKKRIVIRKEGKFVKVNFGKKVK